MPIRRMLGLWISLALIACSPGRAPSPDETNHLMSRVEVVPEIVDLGRLEVGSDAMKVGEFRLRNRGTGPLAILKRSSSCGCTVPEWPPDIIPPGGEALVKFSVKPKWEAGAHGSTISFTTNDPATPTVAAKVRWIERTAIAFEPKAIDFGRVEIGKPYSRTIEVVLSPRMAGLPLEVKPNFAGLAVPLSERHPRTDNPEDGIQINMSIRLTPDEKAGSGATELRIEASGGHSASLPITWRSGPPIEAAPKSLYHSAIAAGSKVTSRVIVSSADGSPFEVIGLEIDEVKGVYRLLGGEQERRANRVIVEFDLEADHQAGIRTHEARIRLSGEGPPLVLPVTLVVQ